MERLAFGERVEARLFREAGQLAEVRANERKKERILSLHLATHPHQQPVDMQSLALLGLPA